MSKKNDKQVNILGVTLFGDEYGQLLTRLGENLAKTDRKKVLILFTPTTEQVVMASQNDAFCSTLNSSTINIPDSAGLVWADWWLSRRQGREWLIRQRMPGVEVAEWLVLKALKQGKKVFLVGGRDSAAKAAGRFKIYDLGFKNKIQFDGGAKEIAHETEQERERVLNKIRQFKPAVVLVAYGAPWQEQWILDNRDDLEQAGVRVAMVVGGAFDIWARKVPRAPLYWRKIGLEWLWRLMREPWRWRRQMRLMKFVGRVGRELIRQPDAQAVNTK